MLFYFGLEEGTSRSWVGFERLVVMSVLSKFV